MSTRPFVIVCAVDLSEFAPSVIEHALDQAHRHRTVDLHFLTVVETSKHFFSHGQPTSLDLENTDEQLRELVEESLPAFADSSAEVKRKLRFHTRAGAAEDEIVELAHEARADRIVLGRHGARKRRAKMGGIAGKVVEAAPCTVHVVQLGDYEGAREDFEQCIQCMQSREDTGGDVWFCAEHSEGRAPRLMRSVGVSTPTPGWGVF